MTSETDTSCIDIVSFYDYECQNIIEWLEEYDREATKAKWTDRDKYKRLGLFLGKDAEDWYHCELEKPDFPTTWLGLSTLILRRFGKGPLNVQQLHLPFPGAVLEQLVTAMKRNGSKEHEIIRFLRGLNQETQRLIREMEGDSREGPNQ